MTSVSTWCSWQQGSRIIHVSGCFDEVGAFFDGLALSDGWSFSTTDIAMTSFTMNSTRLLTPAENQAAVTLRVASADRFQEIQTKFVGVERSCEEVALAMEAFFVAKMP